MAVNFSKNQDEITKAWRDVTDSSNTPMWALFGYEGSTNVIKLMATGTQGLDELVEEFNCSLIQYAFCRVIDESLGLNRLILINWQGDSAPLSRKGLCASHVGDVSNYFKGCAQTITIRNDDEATKEHLMEQILKTSASRMGLSRISSQASTTTTKTTKNDNSMSSFNAGRTLDENNDSSSVDTPVSSSTEAATTNTPSSVYKKVDIGSDIAASRKTFWQRQEEEEKERLAEEKRRSAEKQAQFEKERKQREESEAKNLAESIRKREQLIEATKKADNHSANANQPSSIVSTTTTTDTSDDDGRVGRRSELLRLERNQETQSLITKGLIKNKRAIFEQAQQQQQQQQQQPTLSRRSSSAIITKRVNAFKSLDISSNSNLDSTSDGSATVGKLSNSFAKQINIDGDESANASTLKVEDSRQASNVNSTHVKREVETVTLVRDDVSSAAQSPQSVVSTTSECETANLNENSKNTSLAPQTKSNENGAEKVAESQDVNGNSEKGFSINSSSIKEATTEQANELITNEQLIMNGKSSNVKAIALYDYQAADNTEISFDPDDQIGHIQKVDSGWWHGQVLTGSYKGQIGLFPANYVQEL